MSLSQAAKEEAAQNLTTATALHVSCSRIAREEILGPVLSIIPFEGGDEAIEIANDPSAYVQDGSIDRTKAVARCLRAGDLHLNRTLSFRRLSIVDNQESQP